MQDPEEDLAIRAAPLPGFAVAVTAIVTIALRHLFPSLLLNAAGEARRWYGGDADVAQLSALPELEAPDPVLEAGCVPDSTRSRCSSRRARRRPRGRAGTAPAAPPTGEPGSGPMGAPVAGGTSANLAPLLRGAVAVELTHPRPRCCHDDVIDDDARRGSPSLEAPGRGNAVAVYTTHYLSPAPRRETAPSWGAR